MKKGIAILISFTLLVKPALIGQDIANRSTEGAEKLFQKAHREHLVLAQYYRWFQVFERELTDARIRNHMELLSDSVLITTYSGPMKGKDGMLGFLDFVSSWENAHHIEKTDVKWNKDGTISLEADVLYQNILPEGTKNAYRLHYTTRLQGIEGELPIFTEIKLLPAETISDPAFEDAYAENRSKSFIYYWLYLMDHLEGNESKLRELLASDFHLNLATEEIANYSQLESWIKGEEKKFICTLHTFRNLKVTSTGDSAINVSVDIEWKGIAPNGKKMIGEKHYEWLLENNPDERFARMKALKVTQTNAARIVGEF